MACESCNAKFSFFTRKKQCMDCKRYFCSECVTKRLGKIVNCDSCRMLSRRPLLRSLIIQMRSKDLRQYLLAKKVSTKGCIEKEDLIRLLMLFANGTVESCSGDHADNVGCTFTKQQTVGNCQHHNSKVFHQQRENNENTRSNDSEISEVVPVVCTNSNDTEGATAFEEEKASEALDKNSSSTFLENVNPIKLSDINALSELEHLSVKQLKILLNVNRVEYRDCVEKDDLLNRASMLWKEFKESRVETEILDENLCKICWAEPIECVLLECGHLACCLNCGKQMSECPICKRFVVRVVRFFKA